jgi:hypothetical protein
MAVLIHHTEIQRALSLVVDVAAGHRGKPLDWSLEHFLEAVDQLPNARPDERLGKLVDAAAFALLTVQRLLDGEPVSAGGDRRRYESMPHVVASGGPDSSASSASGST